MSALYDRVRGKAVNYALLEYGKNVQEVGAENRGERIDVYMRAATVGVPRNNPTWVGRDWCGMFIYWCYMRAAQELSLRLPFHPDSDMWSGEKMVNWGNRNPTTIINSSPGNSGGAVVLKGDIYVAPNYHIGMAMEDSHDGVSFLSIDGNQSTANSRRSSITINNTRRIINCRVIIRI